MHGRCTFLIWDDNIEDLIEGVTKCCYKFKYCASLSPRVPCPIMDSHSASNAWEGRSLAISDPCRGPQFALAKLSAGSKIPESMAL